MGDERSIVELGMALDEIWHQVPARRRRGLTGRYERISAALYMLAVCAPEFELELDDDGYLAWNG